MCACFVSSVCHSSALIFSFKYSRTHIAWISSCRTYAVTLLHFSAFTFLQYFFSTHVYVYKILCAVYLSFPLPLIFCHWNCRLYDVLILFGLWSKLKKKRERQKAVHLFCFLKSVLHVCTNHTINAYLSVSRRRIRIALEPWLSDQFHFAWDLFRSFFVLFKPCRSSNVINKTLMSTLWMDNAINWNAFKTTSIYLSFVLWICIYFEPTMENTEKKREDEPQQ